MKPREDQVELDAEASVHCAGVFSPYNSRNILVALPEYSAKVVQTRMDEINRKAAKGLKIKDPIGYLVSSFNKPWVNQ